MSDDAGKCLYQHCQSIPRADDRTVFKCMVHTVALVQQHLFLSERNSGVSEEMKKRTQTRQVFINLTKDLNEVALTLHKNEELQMRFKQSAKESNDAWNNSPKKKVFEKTKVKKTMKQPVKMPAPSRTKWQGLRDLYERSCAAKHILQGMYKLNDENLKKSLGSVLRAVLTDEEAERADRSVNKQSHKSGQLERIQELLDPDQNDPRGKWRLAERTRDALTSLGSLMRKVEVHDFHVSRFAHLFADTVQELRDQAAVQKLDREVCHIAVDVLMDLMTTFSKHFEQDKLINRATGWWYKRWFATISDTIQKNFWVLVLVAAMADPICAGSKAQGHFLNVLRDSTETDHQVSVDTDFIKQPAECFKVLLREMLAIEYLANDCTNNDEFQRLKAEMLLKHKFESDRKESQIMAQAEIQRFYNDFWQDDDGKQLAKNDAACWWNVVGRKSFPLMYLFWKKLRCVPVHNANVERLVSKAAAHTSDKRFQQRDVELYLMCAENQACDDDDSQSDDESLEG